MILGMDFDNTIACYDGLFHAAAVAQGLLSHDAPTDKQGVRDALRASGRDADFTILQGYVYGPGMVEAAVYPDVRECVRALRDRGVPLYIVSHKTRHPYLGPCYDLHDAALVWLETHFFAQGLLEREHVFFELTKQAKLERITALGCTHFVDDLPEVLLDPHFPAGVQRILFGLQPQQKMCVLCCHWQEVQRFLLAELAGQGAYL